MCHRKQVTTVNIIGDGATVNAHVGDVSSGKVEPTKEKTDDKKEKLKLVAEILGVIIALIGLIAVLVKNVPEIPLPNPTSELSIVTSVFIPTSEPPTVTSVFTPTSTPPTYTTVPTDTPVPIDTPIPTNSPTSTTLGYDYKVGVLKQNPDCGEKDKNKDIIDGLINLGFINTTEVAVTSENDFDGYRVLYIPYGWFCSRLDYDLPSIRNFLDRTGTGLLIGDPNPDKYFKFDLLPFDVDFYPMEEDIVSEQRNPDFFDDYLRHKFESLFLYTKDYEYPIAESNLSIVAPTGYYRVLVHPITTFPSFITSFYDTPRFVIMPGSEYSVSKNAIPPELMRNIILWLAHAPLN